MQPSSLIPLAALAALATPSLARAQGLEFGPFTGIFLASPEHELYDAAAGNYTRYSAPGVAIGGRVAYLPVDFFGGEAEIEADPIGTQGNGTAAILGWRLQALAVVPRDGVAPFWVAGIGNLAVLSPAAANGRDLDFEFHLGTGVRVPLTDTTLLRADFRDILSAQKGTSGGFANHFGLNVGLAFLSKSDETPVIGDTDGDGLRDDKDACPTEPETVNGFQDEDGCPDTIAAAPTIPESITTNQPDADPMVWVPHPYCRFLPASEAKGLLAQLRPGDELQVIADGYIPVSVPIEAGETKVELAPITPIGALIVVAWPRDEVSVEGKSLTVGDDGIAVVMVPEGNVDVTVRGGGRDEVFPAYVPTGDAVWLRIPPPPAQIIRFRVGTSDLDKEATATIAGLASQPGSYTLTVQGSASPEGNLDANLKLAARRGEICRDKLLESGIPADRLTLGPPTVGLATGSVDDLRSCILHPKVDEGTK